MKNKLLLISLFVICICKAQTKVVTGLVKDAKTQAPIAYCNIIHLGTTQGTSSNEKGIFSITIKDQNPESILLFTALGYQNDTLHLSLTQNNYTILLQPSSMILEDIVITGVTKATLIRENPISITAVSTQQIERTPTSNIVDALVKNVPGLTAVKTGPNISKPFIHGLGYNRVLTLYDGIRQEGQQYGDEHGLEVDDYNIDKAEVIKGPASLLYGSDAIAGVISLFPKIPYEYDGRIHGKFQSEYQTNNNLIGNGLRLDYADNAYLMSLSGSYRMAKNYQNPIDGRVYLTNFNTVNLSGLIGYQSENGHIRLNMTAYDNRQGIPDGSRDSLSRKFTKQIFDGDDDDILNRPVVSDSELNSYKVPDLSQRIQHYRLYLQGLYLMDSGSIDFTLGGQQNIRREYTHPTMPKQAGMFMRLNTLNYGVRYNASRFWNIESSIGISGMLQNNRNKDATDFPIPDYNLYDGGIYGYVKWKKERWTISGGLRYDLRNVSWNDFYVGQNPLTGFDQQTDAQNPNATLQFEAYNNTFGGLSGSLGTTYKITDNISLKANIGRAYRSPNITEIGSNGLDPGAHIIYLGNRNFGPEFSLQEDFGASMRFRNFTAEASLFNNNIKNYIYMETVADANGIPILDPQGNRTYQYQQAAAHLYGCELWLAIHPEQWGGLRWDNSLSFVEGRNTKSIYKNQGTQGEYLPLIPPLKWTSSISYSLKPQSRALKSVNPKIEWEYNGNQNHFLGLNNTETASNSYTLLNIGLVSEWNFSKNQTIQLIIQADNILDTAYQSHLNRLKYFEYYTQSPNGKLGIYDMGRNISLKIIVPF